MRSRALLLVAMAAATLVAAPLPFPRPRKADGQALQGEWVTVRQIWRGAEQRDGDAVTVSVSGNRISFFMKGERRSVWDFRLDPTKSPKHMDLLEVGSKNAVLAVYQVKGDTLTFAYGSGRAAERPSDLEGKNPMVFVHEFKRKR